MNKYFKERKEPFLLRMAEVNRLVDSAKEKYTSGLYYSALNDLTKVLMMDPKHYYALYLKSLCLSGLGDYAEALAIINRAIDINPEFEEAYVERGNLWQKNNNHAQAIMDYTKALEFVNDDFNALYNRGYVYLINDLYEEAEMDFAEIIKYKPFDADAYNNLGLACYHQGKEIQALAFLYKSIELDPLSDAKNNLKVIKQLKKQKKSM